MNFRGGARFSRSTFNEPTSHRSLFDEPPYGGSAYDRPSYVGSIYDTPMYGEPTHHRPTYGGPTHHRPTYGRSTYTDINVDRTIFGGSKLDESTYPGPPHGELTFGTSRVNGPKFREGKSDYPNTHGHLPATDTIGPNSSQKNSTHHAPSSFWPDFSQNNSSGTTCPHCHQKLKTAQSPANTFQASLNKFFPGAHELEDFVFQTKQTLVPKGFYPRVNTFVCVGLCRDEITSPFEEEVEAMWGQAFICGSLGGMLFCGNTGFAAAHHHAPDAARIIYYCFTHIAIDHEGVVGSVYRTRSGMSEKTTACGALAAFTNEIASNKLNLNFDENDIEMSMLRKHIIDKSGLSTDPKSAPDLLKVTLAAYKTITIDLEKHARYDAEKFKDRQYALFTGVQVHGPEGSDYCWLGKASLLIKGQLLPLTLATSTTSLSSLIGPPGERH